MKLRVIALALFVAVGTVASAQEPATAEAKSATEIKGEVVAVDSSAKTLTLRSGEGESTQEWILAVDSEALDALTRLEAGKTVVATCKDGTSVADCVVIGVTASAS